MTKKDRDIRHKLKVLRRAEKTGHVARTCRHFGVGRSNFYRWQAAYDQFGAAGLVNAKPIPKNPASQAQRFIAKHSAIHNTFAAQRHLVSRKPLRTFRAAAFAEWSIASAAAA